MLGAGPAGLYAALQLARRGIPVTVLERESEPGGLTAGTEIAGMPVDYGSHRLHVSIDGDILADLRSILGDDLQTRRRDGRIRLGESWISFPIALAQLVTALRLSTVLRLGFGAVRAIPTPSRTESFADVVSSSLGKPMGELFYFPYARKIWGVEPDELSGEQARRRISADSPWKLIGKALSRSGTGHAFYYPRKGFGQIPAGLAAAATAAGAEIRYRSPVVSISGEPPEMVVATPREEISASLMLSTIPVTTLARFSDPPEDVGVALDYLRYRAMVLAYLVVPVAQWTPFDAHYFPSSDTRFTRVSEPKNYRDGPDPMDHTVLCVEIPCDPGDPTWSMGDQDVLDRVRRDIRDAGLPDPGSEGAVHRIPNAYPIYLLGSEAAFSKVADWIDTWSGVVTYGRQGLFAHDNTHHALVMARDAVRCISDDLEFDQSSWEEARARFADHVVED